MPASRPPPTPWCSWPRSRAAWSSTTGVRWSTCSSTTRRRPPGPGSTGSREPPNRSPRPPGSAPPPGEPTYGRGPHPPAAALRVARRRPPVRRRAPMPIRIDLAQLQELLDGGGQLVEVLPAAEYADEHLPGAISLPLKQLDATTAAQLDPARPVIVYCWDSL